MMFSSACLDAKLVREARQAEMDDLKSMDVYAIVPRSDQSLTGGPIIKTRWIDTNKGDSNKPNYRSRLVGK